MPRKKRDPFINAQMKALKEDELYQQYKKEKRRVQSLLRTYNKNTGANIRFKDIFNIPDKPTIKNINDLTSIRSQQAVQDYIRSLFDVSKVETIPSERELKLANFRLQTYDFPPEIKTVLDEWVDNVVDEIGWDKFFETMESLPKMKDVDWKAWKYYSSYAVASTTRWVAQMDSALSEVLSEDTKAKLSTNEDYLYMWLDRYDDMSISVERAEKINKKGWGDYLESY